MELPEELWIIIKNYIFDYQKYWKNKFRNVLKLKILNEIRETSYFNLNNYERVTCVESIHLRFGENSTHYYNDRVFYPNRTEFRLYGWYPFTSSEKEKRKIYNIKKIYKMLK